MRKLIDLPEDVISVLQIEADKNRRKLKQHMEYILIRSAGGSNQLRDNKN